MTDVEMGFKEVIELHESSLLGSLKEEEMRTRTGTGRGGDGHVGTRERVSTARSREKPQGRPACPQLDLGLPASSP